MPRKRTSVSAIVYAGGYMPNTDVSFLFWGCFFSFLSVPIKDAKANMINHSVFADISLIELLQLSHVLVNISQPDAK